VRPEPFEERHRVETKQKGVSTWSYSALAPGPRSATRSDRGRCEGGQRPRDRGGDGQPAEVPVLAASCPTPRAAEKNPPTQKKTKKKKNSDSDSPQARQRFQPGHEMGRTDRVVNHRSSRHVQRRSRPCLSLEPGAGRVSATPEKTRGRSARPQGRRSGTELLEECLIVSVAAWRRTGVPLTRGVHLEGQPLR